MKVKRTSNGARILAKTRSAAHRNISNGVSVGLETMNRLCPVDKGDLISTNEKQDDGAGTASLATGGPSKRSAMYVNHHIFNEWGTVKMEAQPYFRPGIDAAAEAIKKGQKIVS